MFDDFWRKMFGRQTACRQMLITCETQFCDQLKMVLRLFLFLFGSSAKREILLLWTYGRLFSN